MLGFMTRVMETKQELIEALNVAAELEHLLMCQYLFAAFSLKRSPDEGLTTIQTEQVRRWGSKLTLVARQEMEHLGLVMNLLSAIGAQPMFKRPNFPQRRDLFPGANLLQTLTPFSVDTLARFVHFEKPHPEPAPNYCGLPAEPHSTFSVRVSRAQHTAFASNEGMRVHDAVEEPDAVRFDSVQDLYEQLIAGFAATERAIGTQELFSGDPNRQIWGGPTSPLSGTMNDLSQYGLDLTRVVDGVSARAAMEKILIQGEGTYAEARYIEHTHYCLFSEVLEELRGCVGWTPTRPVVENPMVQHHEDVAHSKRVHIITNGETRQVAELGNECYELMLRMLLTLYSIPSTNEERAAFMDAAFFPMMTMFVRPLAEILTSLPAFADGTPGNAGLGFELPAGVPLSVAPERRTAFEDIQRRLDALCSRFGSLAISRHPNQYPQQAARLDQLGRNMRRLADDWRQRWTNVGRTQDEGQTV